MTEIATDQQLAALIDVQETNSTLQEAEDKYGSLGDLVAVNHQHTTTLHLAMVEENEANKKWEEARAHENASASFKVHLLHHRVFDSNASSSFVLPRQ